MDPTWSYQSVSKSADLKRWSGTISEIGTLLDTVAPNDCSFRGELAARRIGDFGLLNFCATSHSIGQSKPIAPRLSDGHLLISLQLDGEAQLSQDDRSVHVGAGTGAVGIVDTSKPFQLNFPRETQRIFVFVPWKCLGPNASLVHRIAPSSLDRDNPAVEILRAYMESLADPECRIDDSSATILLEGFVSTLIAAAVMGCNDLDTKLANADRRRLALHETVSRHLDNPRLSARLVAAELGISVRLVHKMFEGSGTSFGSWVRNKRLDECARAIRTSDSGTSIADLAYSIGFNDLSHFNRTFKDRFGVTPTQLRRKPMMRGLPETDCQTKFN